MCRVCVLYVCACSCKQNKKMAYLLDSQTINVKNLVTQSADAINHDCRIDWLELNTRGNLLLFRCACLQKYEHEHI